MTSKIIINKALARHLIDKQFPEWSHLPIEPVKTVAGIIEHFI